MVGRGGWPPARTYDPDLLSYAWAARKGPAILSMGIGATGTFYQYDISRAYSAALRECQTTDPCFTKWERVVAPRWADLRGNDVAYVFARIGVTLPPDFPIPACPLKIVHRRGPLDSGIAWLYGEHSMFLTKPPTPFRNPPYGPQHIHPHSPRPHNGPSAGHDSPGGYGRATGCASGRSH